MQTSLPCPWDTLLLICAILWVAYETTLAVLRWWRGRCERWDREYPRSRPGGGKGPPGGAS